jgi:chemosensory pili system protein ChpA (sensor histidine kinase/response regulator)
MDHATLQWVQGDIEDTLTQARTALERFSEDSHSSHHVQSCADALHSVHGVLEMLEYYGACLLLEEMESLCRILQRAETGDANEEMCELLLRSILQLGEYLNYLRAGHQDTPTIFMPLLNDLRCVRGEPLLSENALFAPDLEVDVPLPEKTHDLDGDQLREIARRLRAYYQKGLLDWYQGTVDETGLSLMQAVVARCEKLCGGTPSVRLWWIAAGVIEALRDGGLDASVSVRRLLGLLDQQLKTVSRDGPAAMSRAAPADLVKNLLYYLARSTSDSARVSMIRDAYRLDELFVGEAATERAERILTGPDLESLKVVAAGIREDLNAVKTALDSHVRQGGQGESGQGEAVDLAPVADKLRRVADTLGLLNFGRSRKLVASHVEQLRGFAESPGGLTEAALMEIAGDLLRVDATLDNIAEHGLDAGEERDGEPVTAGSGDTELNSIEYLRLVTAVVGEATTELAAIKHIIGEYLREPQETNLLDDISRHVSVVEGSLRMLSLERAADLLRDWGRCAASLLSGREFAPRHGTLDALADALVGLEYYLESVVGLQPNDHALLEFTEDCIRSLERSIDQARDDLAASGIGEPAVEAQPVVAEEVDDDILQVFIEEAREVIQVLRDCLIRWNADPGDRDALITVRRSFHTLKGSGRLVGAVEVGEFAWAVENLLNRVIEGICPVTRGILDFVTEANERLPSLIDALATGEPVELDVDTYAERARELLTPQPGAAAFDAASDAAQAPAEEPGRVTVSDDGQMVPGESDDTRRIFIGEAERILELSEAIVEHWRESTYDPRFVTELQRELHTLKGGALTAGLTAVGDLSHAMESVLMMVADEHLPPSETLLDLIEDCHDRLEVLLKSARDKHDPASVEDLITRMDDLVCPGVSGAGPPEPAQGEASITSGLAEVTRGGAVASSASATGGNGRLVALEKGERIQISSSFMDNLSDYAGELTISQSRFGQQVGSFKYNLEEMDQTITRLRDQLRRLEIETEAQVQYRKDQAVDADSKREFDSLELDRYSKLQQLSRSLLESVSDLRSIREILGGIARESDDILAEQSRVSKDLQQGLMRTRLLPFSEQVQRFRRLVRRTMTELDKRVELEVEGQDIRLDRTILERITPSLEHLLRNAVDHGIESPEKRKQAGKREIGSLRIAVSRSGPEVVIKISDDGNGLDQNAIYQMAVQKNMVAAGAKLTDEELFQLILEPGFSTMQEVTQISGRGVGLDVVNADIKQFGGTLDITSRPGQGCMFTIRLPFTLAVNQALLVMVDDENFALPISNVAGVVRVSRENLRRLETEQAPSFEYAGSRYRFAHLGTMLEFGEPDYDESRQPYPIVLVHAGEHRMAFLVENLTGRHEIVVKPLGPQLSGIQWLSGATVLGDGRVAMILDVPAVMRRAASLHGVARDPSTFGQPSVSAADAATVMVVDDSITVRQVTQRLLNRNGIEVFTAKDGVEALAMLKEKRPDLMLLDIEMPRMDGFELAATIRKDDDLKDLPIIMITSRTGKKHSDHAAQIGVNRYLGKPYHESELLENINSLLGRA